MVHAEDIAGVHAAWAATIEQGTPADQFMRIRRADGVERWVRVRTVPERAADGAVVGRPAEATRAAAQRVVGRSTR
jgi:PAS domain-containing protein